ncbi:uncharacterized protein LOC133522220 [Cydia pomonella]|uniref:uncharacterized protein LOC133522220 n=1 Tax=Cydia pomonella TaxID=82600 RepID=UPI002ADD3F50|nr:uncharacterized protein LOC133522220 [Cydia pomonella]
MKLHIFLIVLDFTQLCVSIETNISIQDQYDLRDHITLLRGKRQLPEYTRWQSNLVTSKREFIVKVDDEVFNPTYSTPVVGINIQSVTKEGERIIIGGAIVPPVPTSGASGFETTPVEYTRFVPPTTVRTTGDNDVVYPLVKEVQGHVLPPFSLQKHSNRDESPPAGPHFITRTPALAQQFAPITPVAFYPRLTPLPSPVTPPSVTKRILQFTPSRSPPSSVIDNTRTSLDMQDFNMLHPQSEEAKELKAFLSPLARYEIQTDTKATRTNSPEFVTNFPTWTEETENIPTRQTADPDTDVYHITLYNDDDNDVDGGKKKTEDLPVDDTQIDKRANRVVDAESDEEADSLDIDMKYSNRRNEIPKSKTSSIETISSVTQKLSATPLKSKTTNDVEAQRQSTCSLLNYRPLRFSTPQTLPEIVRQLKQWEEKSPIVKLIDITANNLTTMDNPIYMMIVDDPSSGQVVTAKDIVMIVAGIQGRDHHAVSAAMYLLYQLIEHTDTQMDLLKKFRLWVIPVFNPDGYDYSMTFTQRREWKKNLQQSWEVSDGRRSSKACESYGFRCIVQPCYGVNLDRNFEYQWIPAEELRAEHPCGDLYAGPRQLSERETRALTTFLHEQKMLISTFIAFKEGDVLGVMYPYSHTRKKRAFDANYRRRASRAASAAFGISGRPYVAGQTSEFLPLYAGGIEDWIDGHLGIDNTYTIMMFRATDSHNSKLMTEHVVHEAYAAMDTLLLENNVGPIEIKALNPSSPPQSSAENTFPNIFILSAAILFFNS